MLNAIGDLKSLPREQRRQRWSWLSPAVAALVAGTRLLLVARWAGDGPYMDDCNVTGWCQIRAGTGDLTLKYLVSPHFEHRVITERLFSLGLAWANGGQWDVRLEMVAAACLWGVFAGVLCAFGASAFRGWSMVAWAVLVFFAEAIPHGWQNLLWAFQVQFLFLAAFSVLAFWLVAPAKAFSFRWWGGMVCGLAACGSQGAGILVWPVLLVVLAARFALARSIPDRRALGGWGVLVIAMALALWANAYTEQQTWFHPQSIGTWGKACVALFAWPWNGFRWAALIIWLPCLASLARRNRFRAQPVGLWGLALVLWSVAQILAAAWARGSDLAVNFPPSRYADILVFGVLANGWLILGWVQAERAGPGHRWRQSIAALWIVGMVAGMFCYTFEWSSSPAPGQSGGLMTLADFVASRRTQTEAYRKYSQTGDMRDLTTNPAVYPSVKDLAEIVDRLRAAGRWPATLIPGKDAQIPRLSRVARAAGIWGWGVIGLGAAAILWAVRRERHGQTSGGVG